ncbi:hypothetical protein X798_02476 [Onchocerca flexuosa]|uniref:Anti-proliferative protein domain-containing protein n=1 Tax=Onchocerca flexuosa TaxID=387005 RepID=A0A238BYY5_9BILA|nr:hypothetical protein X798_02476 [Onchocerca flexuosa]
MYTEIKEMMNFLAIFMYHRILRRRIALCMASYANHLLTLFYQNWRPYDPRYAQNERVVAVRTYDNLDNVLHVVATNLRVNIDDLLDCFPSNIVVYCNPGEVTCRISGYSSLIIIWRGEVNEDRYYVPTPIGAARYYDGNILNILNPMHEPSAHLFGRARNWEVNPERCIPLYLVSSVEISIYDLVVSGIVDIFRIPPILFRYNLSYNDAFMTRTFASTRFGMYRPGQDPEDNFSMTLQLTNSESEHSDVTALDDQDTITTPSALTFPNTVSSHDHAYSVTDFTNLSSVTYSKSDQSNSSSGIVNSSLSMFPNPSRSFATSDQFAANVQSASTTESTNHSFYWDNVSSTDNVKSHAESVEYPIYNEFGQLDYIWSYTASINNSDTLAAFRNDYDIWKPISPLDNGSSTGPHQFVNNYNNNIFDSPCFAAHNESNLMQPYENPSNLVVNSLLNNLSNFPFLDTTPNLFPTQASPQTLTLQVSSPQVLLPQLQQSQMLLPHIPSPQILHPQMLSSHTLPPQVMSARAFLQQTLSTQILPLQIMSQQMLPSSIYLPHALLSQIPQSQVLPLQVPQSQVLLPQVSQPQILPSQIPQSHVLPPQNLHVQVLLPQDPQPRMLVNAATESATISPAATNSAGTIDVDNDTAVMESYGRIKHRKN